MNKKIKKYLYFLSILLIIEGLFPDSMLKGIMRPFFWMIFFFIPYPSIRVIKTTFSRSSILIIISIILLGILMILRSVFIDDNSSVLGNVYLTLFGNTNVGALTFFMPVLIFISFAKSRINILRNILYIILAITFPVVLYNLFIINKTSFLQIVLMQTLVFLLPFLPYISKKIKKVTIITIVLMLIMLWRLEERALFLSFFIVFIIYIFTVFFKNILFYKLSSFFLIFSSVLVIFLGLYLKVSVFELIPQMMGEDNDKAVDSRTFLYVELVQDLNLTHSWFLGKGILGSYYSEVMDNASSQGIVGADNAHRIGSEAGFLHYLLKGGVLYLIIYMLIIIMAVYSALRKSKNTFLRIVAIILSTHFFLSSISEFPSFNLYNMFFWILIGFCFSNYVLSLSDKDIKRIVNLN